MNSNRSPLRVLLVEDGSLQAVLTQRAIKDLADLEMVHLARDGEQALKYLHSQPRPDLILLDLEMPKMDGFHVLAQIKEDLRLRAAPVVVFSASEDAETISKAYQLGASTFIVKPSEFIEVKAAIENVARYWSRAKLPQESVEAA